MFGGVDVLDRGGGKAAGVAAGASAGAGGGEGDGDGAGDFAESTRDGCDPEPAGGFGEGYPIGSIATRRNGRGRV